MVTQNTFGTNSGPNVSIGQQTTANVSLIPTTPVPTFAQLPGPTTVPPGTIEYTSDQGLVYSNGTSWQTITAGTLVPYAPSGDTTGVKDVATLQALINALSTAGGGTINLNAGTYYLNASLIPKSNVAIIGVLPTQATSGQLLPAISTSLPSGGTIFSGVGSVSAFRHNKTANGSPTQNSVFSSGVQGFKLQNISFTNFVRGIDAGAAGVASFYLSQFIDLNFYQMSDWGIYIVNCQLNVFTRCSAYGCVTGGIYNGENLSYLVDQMGNNIFDYPVCLPPNNSARCLVVDATNQSQTGLNYFRNYQGARYTGSTTTIAMTCSASSPNITVTSSVGLAVGMPVTVSASVNGFVTGQTYFISYLSGTTIQLSNNYVGASNTETVGPGQQTAQTATLNSTTTIAVTNGAAFSVNMPVVFNATSGGIIAGVTYYVSSVSGNNVTVAYTPSLSGSFANVTPGTGSATISPQAVVVASSNSAVNLITNGFPGMEFINTYSGSHAGYELDCLDLETSGQVALLMQNCANFQVRTNSVPAPSLTTQTLCLRQCSENFFYMPSFNSDQDSSCSQNFFIGVRQNGSVQNIGYDFGYDIKRGTAGINFSQGTYSTVFRLEANNTNYTLAPVNCGIQQQYLALTSGGQIYPSQIGAVDLYDTSAKTYTLPTINTAQLGLPFDICRNGASTGNATLTCGGSNTFNGVTGYTSIQLAPGAAIRLIACNSFSGGSNYWIIAGFSGTYTSGTKTVGSI